MEESNGMPRGVMTLERVKLRQVNFYLKKREQELEHIEVTEEDFEELESLRPTIRADCENIPRPCPFLGCNHNLLLHRGLKVIEWVDGDEAHYIFPDDLPSCVLDVIDNAGELDPFPSQRFITEKSLCKFMGMSAENVKQIWQIAVSKIDSQLLMENSKGHNARAWRELLNDLNDLDIDYYPNLIGEEI